MLSSCGQETLSGGEPNPGGLCSKKRTSLLLNRVAGSLGEGWRGTSSCGRPVGSLPPETSAAAPFLSIWLPLPSPRHCSLPTLPYHPVSAPSPPPLPCETSNQLLWTREPDWGGGLARVPAALPMALLLQPCNLGTAFPPHLAPRLPLFQKARLHGTLTAKPRSLTAPPVKGLHRPGTLQARAQWAERLPKV